MNASYAQIIEKELGDECALCRYHTTHFYMVIKHRLVPICGRCAEQLREALVTVTEKDERR